MRIRPAIAVATLTGGAFILAAIAAQAQAAEMARDIKAIRQRMDEIYQHLQDTQIGAVESAVEQVEDLVERFRAHGAGDPKESEMTLFRRDLRMQKKQCMNHLKTAVTRLENASSGSPRQAEESLSKGAVEDVMLYLDLLGQIYAATVQLELAQFALDCHEGMLDLARTRSDSIANTTAEIRHEIEDVCCRLGQLDQSVRAQFQHLFKHAREEIPAAALAGAAGGAVLPTAVKTLSNRGGDSGSDDGSGVEAAETKPTVLAADGGAALGLVWGAKNTVAQHRAQNKLDERLTQLTAASSRSSETMDEVAPSLEMLRTLTIELVGPGESVH